MFKWPGYISNYWMRTPSSGCQSKCYLVIVIMSVDRQLTILLNIYHRCQVLALYYWTCRTFPGDSVMAARQKSKWMVVHGPSNWSDIKSLKILIVAIATNVDWRFPNSLAKPETLYRIQPGYITLPLILYSWCCLFFEKLYQSCLWPGSVWMTIIQLCHFSAYNTCKSYYQPARLTWIISS